MAHAKRAQALRVYVDGRGAGFRDAMVIVMLSMDIVSGGFE
ncbi:MAG: hypothetical protein ACPIGG_09390 [Akkermansiaceae bacterium]